MNRRGKSKMGERSKIRKTRTIREGLMGKQDVNWLWPAVAAFCLVHFTIFSLEFRWPQTRWRRRVYDCAVAVSYTHLDVYKRQL